MPYSYADENKLLLKRLSAYQSLNKGSDDFEMM